MSNAVDETSEVSVEPVNLIVDHRSETAPRGDENLIYPYEDIPGGEKVVEVAVGIYWARIPLPWSLDHINVYLLEEGDGWTLVDTGSNGKRGMETWEILEAKVLGGKPIKHVVATHMHPDHLGLAGWLVERHGARFSMTQTEYLMAQRLWSGASEEFPEQELDYLFKAGVSRSFEDKIRSAGFGNFKRGVYELPYAYERMDDGSIIEMGGRSWRVVIGRGHSPEHACLSCLDEPIFISGDQVLPQISSNVSVYAREPLGNPLAHWITSLDRMRGIEDDPLVLPSHGRVYRGLHNRLDSLIKSHQRKLVTLHDWCSEARTAVETFPALFRREITGFDFFLALGEAVAHLHLLESIGLLSRDFDGKKYRFTATGDAAAVDMLDLAKKLPGVMLRPLSDLPI